MSHNDYDVLFIWQKYKTIISLEVYDWEQRKKLFAHK